MPRYIDADNLAQRIMYYISHVPEHYGEYYAYKVALKEIVGIPTADVVEVKHGEWLEVDSDVGWELVRCSLCGKENCLCDGEDRTDYCPYCGAKMDGKE